MEFFDHPVEIDARAARVFAAGMRAVALADGDVHQRELDLIRGFEAEVPAGADQGGDELGDAELARVYVQSLVMVALADGGVSDVEAAVIRDLAAKQGLGAAEVDAIALQVKRGFLAAFAGVTVFADAVDAVARELGVDPEDLRRIREAHRG